MKSPPNASSSWGRHPPNPRDLSLFRQNEGMRRPIARPPRIPAAEPALGLRPRSALSSAQALPEWTLSTPPCNDSSANGGNPLNSLSHSRGAVQKGSRSPPRDKRKFHEAVIAELLEERVHSSRGMRRPRGVKRKMSGYKLRPRGALSRARIDFASCVRIKWRVLGLAVSQRAATGEPRRRRRRCGRSHAGKRRRDWAARLRSTESAP
jgi:hypothetical protein